MKLTIQHVFDATPVLGAIMRENRPLPSKGKYRIARMHRKMEEEWKAIAERYNAMVEAYGHKRPMLNGERLPDSYDSTIINPDIVMQSAVPSDKLAEFMAQWKELAAEEIEVAVEPIPIDQLCLEGEVGSISAAEFSTLDTLVEG